MAWMSDGGGKAKVKPTPTPAPAPTPKSTPAPAPTPKSTPKSTPKPTPPPYRPYPLPTPTVGGGGKLSVDELWSKYPPGSSESASFLSQAKKYAELMERFGARGEADALRRWIAETEQKLSQKKFAEVEHGLSLLPPDSGGGGGGEGEGGLWGGLTPDDLLALIGDSGGGGGGGGRVLTPEEIANIVAETKYREMLTWLEPKRFAFDAAEKMLSDYLSDVSSRRSSALGLLETTLPISATPETAAALGRMFLGVTGGGAFPTQEVPIDFGAFQPVDVSAQMQKYLEEQMKNFGLGSGGVIGAAEGALTGDSVKDAIAALIGFDPTIKAFQTGIGAINTLGELFGYVPGEFVNQMLAAALPEGVSFELPGMEGGVFKTLGQRRLEQMTAQTLAEMMSQPQRLFESLYYQAGMGPNAAARSLDEGRRQAVLALLQPQPPPPPRPPEAAPGSFTPPGFFSLLKWAGVPLTPDVDAGPVYYADELRQRANRLRNAAQELLKQVAGLPSSMPVYQGAQATDALQLQRLANQLDNQAESILRDPSSFLPHANKEAAVGGGAVPPNGFGGGNQLVGALAEPDVAKYYQAGMGPNAAARSLDEGQRQAVLSNIYGGI